MRLAVLVVSALLLSGCAALPPVIALASWGLDGVVFVATDKTVTDHAISTVAQKDCAVWRGIMGHKICRDYAPGTAPPIRVAAADMVPPPMRRGELVRPAPGVRPAPLPPEESRPIMLASAASGSSPPTRPEGAPAEERLTFRVQRILNRLEQAKAARRPAHSELELAVAMLDEREAQVPPRATLVSAPPPTPPPAPPVSAEPRATLVSLSDTPGRKLRYVVLGSFADPANAARRVAEHAALWPFTAVAVVDGRHYRRVLAGPYPKEQAERILHGLKAHGFKKAWTLPLAAVSQQRLASVLGLAAPAERDGT